MRNSCGSVDTSRLVGVGKGRWWFVGQGAWKHFIENAQVGRIVTSLAWKDFFENEQS